MKKILITGLGNPGIKYINSRHNIGFKIANFIVKKHLSFFTLKKFGYISKIEIKNVLFLILKPNTYMNLSGKSVLYWVKKENIEIKNILIIVDDIYLNIGFTRLRFNGSSGGHKGLKSIEDFLKTKNYARFRFGICNNFPKGKQIEYVLGEFTYFEDDIIKKNINNIYKSIISFGLNRINSNFN